jgi:hypothetical protein
MLEFEGKVEHTTAKAWLIEDNMSGKQGWLPKSVGQMVSEGPDPDGNIIFLAPEWWMKKQGFV